MNIEEFNKLHTGTILIFECGDLILIEVKSTKNKTLIICDYDEHYEQWNDVCGCTTKIHEYNICNYKIAPKWVSELFKYKEVK